MSSCMLKPGCRALQSRRLARRTRLRRRIVPLSTSLPYGRFIEQINDGLFGKAPMASRPLCDMASADVSTLGTQGVSERGARARCPLPLTTWSTKSALPDIHTAHFFHCLSLPRYLSRFFSEKSSIWRGPLLLLQQYAQDSQFLKLPCNDDTPPFPNLRISSSRSLHMPQLPVETASPFQKTSRPKLTLAAVGQSPVRPPKMTRRHQEGAEAKQQGRQTRHR